MECLEVRATAQLNTLAVIANPGDQRLTGVIAEAELSALE